MMNCKPGDLAIIQPPDNTPSFAQLRGLIVRVGKPTEPGEWEIHPAPILEWQGIEIMLCGIEDEFLRPIRGLGTPEHAKQSEPVEA